MEYEAFLAQAKHDAQQIQQLSEGLKVLLEREIDWCGYRMRGYEFPITQIATANKQENAT